MFVLRVSVLGDNSGQSDMLNISLSVARYRKYQYGSKWTQSPFEHSALILVPNPRQRLNVWKESNRGKELVWGWCTFSSDQLGEPKTKGLFHVWLNRCNCVSCSVVFPLVLSAPPSPLWDTNVKGWKHLTAAASCLPLSLSFFKRLKTSFYPKLSFECHSNHILFL